MKENKNIFTADEKDFINSQEVIKKYDIGIGQQIALLDTGKLTAYERLPGVSQWIYADMDPDKWEKITGKSVPDPWPKEGVEVPVECKAEYRCLHINEIGKLNSDKVAELYYLRSEIEVLESSKTPAANRRQGTTERPSESKQIYILAADRAETVLQNWINRGSLLPKTRQKKLNLIKSDSDFQRTIKALPKTVSDKTLIRRLQEARPGIWQLEGKRRNEKYRKKSLYES